jgi:hypothetical protein
MYNFGGILQTSKNSPQRLSKQILKRFSLRPLRLGEKNGSGTVGSVYGDHSLAGGLSAGGSSAAVDFPFTVSSMVW